MLVSFTEAKPRVVPLMDGLSDLANLDVLDGVFGSFGAETRAERLLVRLIHINLLKVADEAGKPLPLWSGGDARWLFRPYIPKPGRNRADHWGYDEYAPDAVFLDSQALDWVLDFLGPEPTLFLDWQLACRWAGMPVPPAREWGLRQRDPDDFPPQVQQRLAWIRRFSSGRKREPDPPSSLPSGRAPLFADGWFGDLNLYSINRFSEFFGQDGFPSVAVGEEGRMSEGGDDVEPEERGKTVPATGGNARRTRKPGRSKGDTTTLWAWGDEFIKDRMSMKPRELIREIKNVIKGGGGPIIRQGTQTNDNGAETLGFWWTGTDGEDHFVSEKTIKNRHCKLKKRRVSNLSSPSCPDYLNYFPS